MGGRHRRHRHPEWEEKEKEEEEKEEEKEEEEGRWVKATNARQTIVKMMKFGARGQK